MTRGYWQRPELDAERFVRETGGGDDAARMYRTGDRARWRADGRLDFLGRDDHQVKLRGHRIELGEIEARLCEHPGVREAVVCVREDREGDARLVAYTLGEARPEAELRAALRASLPDFMLPSHFVELDAFPLTPTARSIAPPCPRPGVARSGAQRAGAPTDADTPLEHTLCGIWRDVLDLDAVDTTANFFDLGGHSLLAVRAHRLLREALDREFPITTLFQYPTVRSLAEHLAAGDAGAASDTTMRARRRRARVARRVGQRGRRDRDDRDGTDRP